MLIISAHSYRIIIFVINLSLRFISWFGRFYEDFTLKEGTAPLPFSRNRPKNHSHNLGKALGKGLGLLKTGSLSLSLSLSPLYPFHLSLSISLPIYLLLPFISLSLLLSIILYGVSYGRFRPCFPKGCPFFYWELSFCF